MISSAELDAEKYFNELGFEAYNFETESRPYPKWVADKLILKSVLAPNKKSFKNLVGAGKPDLLVYDENSRTFALCEVKSKSDNLSHSHKKWFRNWSNTVNCFVLKRNDNGWEAMGWEKGDELSFEVKDSETLEVSKK